jgi:hypothetical protein
MTVRQTSAELIETLGFQFIGQLIQTCRVDARAQTHSACVHNEGCVLGAGTGIRQAAAYSLIQGFLETLPSMLHGIAQQLLYIRIESNCGTHDSCIMSTVQLAVKMLELRTRDFQLHGRLKQLRDLSIKSMLLI